MDPGFYMPPLKIPTVTAGKGAGAEPPDRRSLPKAIIDIFCRQRGLLAPGVGRRFANCDVPGSLWDLVTSKQNRTAYQAQQKNKNKAIQRQLPAPSEPSHNTSLRYIRENKVLRNNILPESRAISK